ncbi:hypothetical protein Syun_013508 [Stephania yunnanensis]|uniref:DUF7795 domain-containing protein n=1 Tax=Stephania yunnanensis TaxID=152371 RepID=A0AAP0JJA4_9MAGN
MTRIAKFEELATLGSGLLGSFRNQLELLQRNPLDKRSKLVGDIIKANETQRMKAYLKDRCLTVHAGVQIMTKLNTCQQGFRDHLNKAKSLLDELECLVDNMISTLKMANERETSNGCESHSGDELAEEDVELVHLKKHEAFDYAAMMGIIYNMLKLDYTMQEKIVSSLKLSSPLEQLDCYCKMWSLRPYINDDVMHQAWKLIR